jgi:hypothetical protein
MIACAGAGLLAVRARALSLRLVLARRLRVVDYLGGLLFGISDPGFLWMFHSCHVPGGLRA